MVKRLFLCVFFVPVRVFVTRRVRFFSLLLLLVTAPGITGAAPQPVTTAEEQTDSAAQTRRQNRERLLASVKKRPQVVPKTPEQTRRESARKQAQRARNRAMLAMHSRWAPGPMGRSETLWNAVQDGETADPHTADRLRTVIRRLKNQLGKPYLWGGDNPQDGFDCSGLVFYAFNHVLERKLPRTANGMYQNRNLTPIHQDRLQQGDLVFFNINRRPGADHVGVYLGDGRFIEAPRTGLNIRISQLSDNFWQTHYLGARRVL